MDERWFKGISSSKRAERKKEILGYRNAFEAILELLESSDEIAKVDYDDSNWSHKQADVNGANRKLNEIRKILTIRK